MKTISVTCPNCSAPLNLDADNLAQYCSHCGSKIMLDVETIQQLLIAREQTKQAQIDAEKNLKLAKIQADTQTKKLEYQEKSERKSFMRENAYIFIIVGILLVAMCFMGMAYCSVHNDSNDSRARHKAAVAELQEIESDLEEAIEDEDYDRAMILANKLRLDDNWSDKETEGWNERREEYIRIIQERQKRDR